MASGSSHASWTAGRFAWACRRSGWAATTSTLLYSMLLEINRPDRCIITVEDPVEYLFEGIAQVQINPRIGWTYAAATRQLLRQAPNVVMVGELRDLEMMQLAAQVAITGHLLLTTMHTNSAVDTVARLLDCGLDAFMINSALGGVIATRLVRTLCGECKAPAEPAAHCPRPSRPSPRGPTPLSADRSAANTAAAAATADEPESSRSSSPTIRFER